MNSEQLAPQASEALRRMRDARPLVHNITNFVVMNFTANTLLASGAAPVMAHAPEEMEEMAAIAGAVVLNIGTLSTPWVESMLAAGKAAAKLGKPVVLDPVGAGASKLRTEAAWRILRETGVRVLRGNASEIMALHNADSKTRGVDSSHEAAEAVDAARALAKELDLVVAVTGKQDMVTDGDTIYHIDNGHELMSCITGTGCSSSAITGAFLAAEPDTLQAAVAALAFHGLAGEYAAKKAAGPGSFSVAFLDSLYETTPELLAQGARISKA